MIASIHFHSQFNIHKSTNLNLEAYQEVEGCSVAIGSIFNSQHNEHPPVHQILSVTMLRSVKTSCFFNKGTRVEKNISTIEKLKLRLNNGSLSSTREGNYVVVGVHPGRERQSAKLMEASQHSTSHGGVVVKPRGWKVGNEGKSGNDERKGGGVSLYI